MQSLNRWTTRKSLMDVSFLKVEKKKKVEGPDFAEERAEGGILFFDS